MNKADNAVLALSRSMYGKHITKKQYEELSQLKTSGEIAEYLKANTPYSVIIDERSQWSDRTLGEAVERYYFACFSKICRFQIAAGQNMYKFFLCKNEVDQILECTSFILGGKKDGYLREFSSFLDKHLNIDLFSMAKADNLQELCDALDKTPYKAIFNICMNTPDFTYLTFEREFYSYLHKFQKKLIDENFHGKNKNEVFETISYQYDIKFIENLTRIISYYGGDKDIRKEISPSKVTNFTEKQIKSLSSCESLTQLDTELSKTPYKALSHLSTVESITDETDRFLFDYYKKQIRFSQAPCVVMFSFLNLLKTEKNNLIKIIEGNKYNIPREEILKSLCMS